MERKFTNQKQTFGNGRRIQSELALEKTIGESFDVSNAIVFAAALKSSVMIQIRAFHKKIGP